MAYFKPVNFSQEYLKEILEYDEKTGVFIWKRHTFRSNKYEGEVAGSLCGRYLAIQISRKRYYLHRLAWYYVYGEWPIGILDHINRNRLDNRISNLRMTDYRMNSLNTEKPRNNTSGFKNVSYRKDRNKYMAYVTTPEGKYKSLGHYNSAEEANEAVGRELNK